MRFLSRYSRPKCGQPIAQNQRVPESTYEPGGADRKFIGYGNREAGSYTGLINPNHPSIDLMSAEFDCVFVGGGHNALTCASYMARAGLNTLVIERLPYVGGGVKTIEKIPYFKYNTYANSMMAVPHRPPYKDLGLDRYCEMILPQVQMVLALENGKSITVHVDPRKTAESISRFSAKDAETFLKQDKSYKAALNKVFIPQSYTDPFSRTDEEDMEFLQSFPEGQFMLDLGSKSLLQHVEETWESEVMKVFECIESVLVGVPFTKVGSTIALPSQTMLRWTYIVKGGSGNFALALRKAFVDAGGQILENSHVDSVIIQNGEAKGVVLAGGKRIMAKKFVVSSVDTIQSFQKFVDPDLLPIEWKTALRDFKYEAVSNLGIFMALREPTKYNEQLSNWDSNINSSFRVYIGFDSLDDLYQEEKDTRNGVHQEDSKEQRFQVLHPSKWDSTQAPAGRQVSFIWDWVKCNGKESYNIGEWDELGPRLAALNKERWKAYAPNMVDENILDTLVVTPLDVTRNIINMVGGALQMRSPEMPPRSLPSAETPISHYYYCGAGTFPGGAVTMAPGYIAANVIAKIEGIKPWWVPVEWGHEYPFLT